MSVQVTPRKPKGFPEYMPAEQIEFNRLMEIIRRTYELFGFTPVDTPVLELAEVLLAKGGGETEQEVFQFRRTENSDEMCMRYDLTVPLARYVAEHTSRLVFPFRRYHIGKVYRAERPQRGRFREFYQCDIDVIGSYSPTVDAEFPTIINQIFDEFAFGEFTIRINNRMVLNGFFESLGYSGNKADVLRIVDKLEKFSREEIEGMLADIGLDEQQTSAVLKFVGIDGNTDEVLQQLNQLEIESETFSEGVKKLEQLVMAIRANGVPDSRFKVDLKIARGLDYYTGTVYETVLNDYPQVGSVCSGGRYDDLAGYYTDQELPGVGISIGLSRLFYSLSELGVINSAKQTPASVGIFPMGEAHFAAATEAAGLLRQQGISVLINDEPGKMGKRMRYAERIGLTYAVIIGDDEVTNKTVTIKTLTGTTWEQKTIPVKELPDNI